MSQIVASMKKKGNYLEVEITDGTMRVFGTLGLQHELTAEGLENIKNQFAKLDFDFLLQCGATWTIAKMIGTASSIKKQDNKKLQDEAEEVETKFVNSEREKRNGNQNGADEEHKHG